MVFHNCPLPTSLKYEKTQAKNDFEQLSCLSFKCNLSLTHLPGYKGFKTASAYFASSPGQTVIEWLNNKHQLILLLFNIA